MRVQWRSYVAVGDSFTEGLDDIQPDGSFRGWADLVAARLASEYRSSVAGRPPAEEQPDFRYANLAVRGRLFDNVVDDQVPATLRMRPDLVSFAAGGNDVLRRRFDAPQLMKRFDEAIRVLRASGADVVVFRFADVTARLPGRRIILPRVEVLNREVEVVADRHGARLVDLWNDAEFHNPQLWSIDRLHMNAVGHRRVAAHVLTALGLEPSPGWWEVPAKLTHSWAAARAADARWVGNHLAPWVRRRLTGRSSGDQVSAKRPTLTSLLG
ncbi:SGNH/GDSL hydrolase family protein [Luedemannella helvata]|uniref:SGNH/GDSL hydrolase family protein n=1 Tax=Luedemannella helvata TaxID=349315 RepID=A0ABP4WJ80_9ACTN